MVKLELGSLYLTVSGADSAILKVVDSVTSYQVEGAWYSSAFRSKAWDGKVHLTTFSRTNGYRVYSGCAADVVSALMNEGIQFEFTDLRRVPAPTVDHGWTGIIATPHGPENFAPRPYQVEAAKAMLRDSFPLGRCMLKLPIRSGKTVLAAMIIGALQVPTLFVVSSDLLLEQTVKLYRSMFSTPVGVIGAGSWDPTNLTVATIQTLHGHVGTPEFTALMEHVDLAIWDECHHFSPGAKIAKAAAAVSAKAAAAGKTVKKKDAAGWKDVVVRCPAYYKVGLSATIYLDQRKANEKANIWLKAATGNIVHEITTKQMIEEGWLLRPIVEMHKVHGPVVTGDWAEDEVHRRGIVNYLNRNNLIVKLGVAEAKGGSQVMVHAHLHEHIDMLVAAFEEAGVVVEKLSGKEKGAARRGVLTRFKRGKVRMLVGNIFGEGLDVPEVDVVIVAEGGESRKKTIQRMRNLTPSPETGKSYVKVIDFLDEHEAHLLKHSRARLKAYRAEDAFDVQVIG